MEWCQKETLREFRKEKFSLEKKLSEFPSQIHIEAARAGISEVCSGH